MIDFSLYIEAVARALLGEPNLAESTKTELAFGTNGSMKVNLEKATFYDHENKKGGGLLYFIEYVGGLADRRAAFEWMRSIGCDVDDDDSPPPRAKRNNGDGNGASAGPRPKRHLVARFPYPDEKSTVLFEVLRYHYKNPDGSLVINDKTGKPKKTFSQRQTHPTKPGEWIYDVEGVRVIPYRLDELQAALRANPRGTVYIFEGEAKVDLATSWDLTATCNAMGAGKWTAAHAAFFPVGVNIVIVSDNDPVGRGQHVDAIAASFKDIAASIRVLHLPGLALKGDVLDWNAKGGTHKQFLELAAAAPLYGEEPDEEEVVDTLPEGISLDDFRAYMPQHNYLYLPTREPWPASSVDARLGTIIVNADGVPKKIKASRWLDQNKPVEQMTWAPGEPMLIENRLIAEGGWIGQPKVTILNLYRPPCLTLGDPNKADPWLDHVRKIYPTDAAHIIRWLAQRVQRPADKINHALVLGGPPGTGKDTLLDPLKRAVGPWNFIEVTPPAMLGRFNGFARAVVLRINEGRDLGDVNRFQFYDRLKIYTAAPPDVLRVDEKNLREHSILNCCGVIITTNYKTNGVHLPADDRRHYVAWTDLTKDDFTKDYWVDLWRWYEQEGYGHVAAYLSTLDISSFNPKAPPPKTAAFWAIVDANRAPEESELADALDRLAVDDVRPDAVTVAQVTAVATTEFGDWLRDRRNRRQIPHRFEECEYTPVRNPSNERGEWIVRGVRQTIYAKTSLTKRERHLAAAALARS